MAYGGPELYKLIFWTQTRVSLVCVCVCVCVCNAGTANGGSALLWASMMHLNNITDGRVITIDMHAPTWDPNAGHW